MDHDALIRRELAGPAAQAPFALRAAGARLTSGK
jgi:hypothetical protein